MRTVPSQKHGLSLDRPEKNHGCVTVPNGRSLLVARIQLSLPLRREHFVNIERRGVKSPKTCIQSVR